MTTTMTTTKLPAISADITASVLTLTFSDGGEIIVNAEALSNDIRNAALMHGLKQKLVDAAAMSRNPDTGRSATLADKFNAVREVADRLMAGAWNKVREGGAGNAGGLLYRALCELYSDKTPEAIKAFLDGKTDEEKAALRANGKIAPIIARIKAESDKKATARIDSDALLGDLE